MHFCYQCQGVELCTPAVHVRVVYEEGIWPLLIKTIVAINGWRFKTELSYE